MYSNSFWKNSYKARKRVDSIDRYPKKYELKNNSHMTPMEVIKEYCNKATLHGIRYTVREGAPTYDRMCWVITLIICTFFAGLFVKTAWGTFVSSPTVTSVETTHLPLHKVPFPAITICPAVKIDRIRGLDVFKKVSTATFLNVTYLNSSMETILEHVMSAFAMLQHPFYDRMVSHLKAIPDLHSYDTLNVTAMIHSPNYINSQEKSTYLR
ncbi:hypothetical protein L9F63_004379 [Diploptera punctata]|uniref:Uncharacterized protein n=1 Tax=Diploptera punctata TaxID=6984 RepID=A0AAD7ZGD6_DIPPU|nr:hypothetical protein L9F63_004379 [Diploptera punctata]